VFHPVEKVFKMNISQYDYERADQHLLSHYLSGQYSDYHLITTGAFQTLYKLHKIIISKSPLLLNLIKEEVTKLDIKDSNISPKGFQFCLQSLYSYQIPTEQDIHFLLSIIGSSSLLGLKELENLGVDLLKQQVSFRNVVEVVLMLELKEYACVGDLRDYLFTFFCSRLVDEILLEYGLVFHSSDTDGLQVLVEMVSLLPFGWVKALVESEHFQIPTDRQRYLFLTRFNFAKLVLEKRKQLGCERENVMVAFGGSKNGVAYVRAKKSVGHSAFSY
jgi:hypothetical protein